MTVRPLETDLPAELLPLLQKGTLRSVYRGVPCLKSPFDLALYLQLFSRQPPQTVFEIGTKFGGSALWLADMLQLHGVEPRIISVDIMPPADFSDPRVTLLKGEAERLGDVLTREMLALPKPWLVVEDSSHFHADSLAVLEFFDPYLTSGDYIVVEDGVVAFMGPAYDKYEQGPTRAVEDFLARRGADYLLDTSLCDHFGRNVTYNPNGWLKRL